MHATNKPILYAALGTDATVWNKWFDQREPFGQLGTKWINWCTISIDWVDRLNAVHSMDQPRSFLLGAGNKAPLFYSHVHGRSGSRAISNSQCRRRTTSSAPSPSARRRREAGAFRAIPRERRLPERARASCSNHRRIIAAQIPPPNRSFPLADPNLSQQEAQRRCYIISRPVAEFVEPESSSAREGEKKSRARLRPWSRTAWPAQLGQAWAGRSQVLQPHMFVHLNRMSSAQTRTCLW
jgi:hypothetical protein